MIYDLLVYLHTNFSTILVGSICVIAGLSFILAWRRFRWESYTSKGKEALGGGVSAGALRELLSELQSTPGTDAGRPSGPISLDQLSERERTHLEREVQLKMAAAGDANTEEGAELLRQLRQKESELESVQAKVKSLQEQLEGAAAADAGEPPAEDVEALREKVQELEAKLKEYEIIEDDIADLSTYKEENARLRAQLDQLGQGGPAAQAEPGGAPRSENLEAAPGAEQPESAAEGGEPAAESGEPAAEGGEPAAVAQSGEADPSSAAAPPPEPAQEPIVDAEQLLSEVDELLTLGKEFSSDSSGLEDDVDTEKLATEAAGMPTGDQSGS